jgi:hypothetical protein
MSLEKAVWVREFRGEDQPDGSIKNLGRKVSHLLDPTSPLVKPRDPFMRIGVPRKTVCGVTILTMYFAPDGTKTDRCGRCQRIADKGQ